MSVQVRRRREAAAFLQTYVGAQGELIVDTSNNRVQVHDGTTPGGWPAAKLGEVVTNTRTNVADASYAVQSGDRTIAYTALTAARTVTLPVAAAFPTGTRLVVMDETGACSATNSITLARAGSDLINGLAALGLVTPFAVVALQSNGASKWTIIDRSTGTLAQQNADAVTIAGGSIASTAIGSVTPYSASANISYGGFTSLRAYGTTDGGANGASQLKLNAPGTATNQRCSIGFYPTFGNFPADTGPRRAADILCGFDSSGKYGSSTNGIWGGEYITFNVGAKGSSNDTETLGTEIIRLTASGYVMPGSDNTQPLGYSDKRWSVVYSGTGTINTSDAREKTSVAPLEDRELAAAKALAGEIGSFRFLAAMEAKSDAARRHIGMTVQRAIEIMTAHDLKPSAYAFICHDSWSTEEGPTDRYGFRVDQLLLFISRGFDARLSALEARFGGSG